MEKYFHVIKEDGAILLRGDDPVRITPSSFCMAHTAQDTLFFVRDNRKKLLSASGGVIKIGDETPVKACIRENKEEVGIIIPLKHLDFVGQFGNLEAVHLFATHIWQGTHYIADPEEVSEIVEIFVPDIMKNPAAFEKEFYPAQWKMLGWYLNYYRRSRKPLFEMWKNYTKNPWPQLALVA